MDVQFLNAGERCITVCFGNEVSIELNTKVRMLKQELEENPINGITETVPTYCALSVHFLPEIIRKKELLTELHESIIRMKPVSDTDNIAKEVPVFYGGETGPDLKLCAELEGISVDELIRRHSEHEYYVYQLGFSPGHPYMARAEEPFSFKRRETPRVDIPAHSVVVQTNLTNITPFHQPSGWNIIGSTPLNITDYYRSQPFFFRAGDHVRLKPIDKPEYDQIKSEQDRMTAENKSKVKACVNTAGFIVEKAGALTTIQDEGRFGYQSGGVSPAGPMDYRSFHLANILVGNKRTAAALEATVIGPSIRFTADTVIAVTGADLSPEINGHPIQMYAVVSVRKDDLLSFGRRKYGCRAYIAFAGGIQEEQVMGSCSTDIKNGLGGHDGRALKAGDIIALCAASDDCDSAINAARQNKENCHLYSKRNTYCLPEYFDDKEITVRVVLGPQDEKFTKAGIRHFFNHSSTVTDKSDRQGIRLDGAPIEFVTDGNIISDGISLGAIQVPNDGKPIILMSDRQSVGGYAKIGNVIYADLPKLAQAMPGCRVRFVQVSPELAEELYLREYEQIKKFQETSN